MPQITHNDTRIPLSFSIPYPTTYIKLYTVPTTYSDDGYYLAIWGDVELQPIPACGVEEVSLLARLTAVKGETTATFSPQFLAEGVHYED